MPLAMGTPDQWEAATMGYQVIGPNYWHGEEGRKALIAGKEKLTDPEWVEPFKQLAKWAPYMGDGYKAQSYPDSPEHVHARPRRHLPGRFVGDRAVRQPGAVPDGRFPGRRCPRPATPATCRTTSTSPSA